MPKITQHYIVSLIIYRTRTVQIFNYLIHGVSLIIHRESSTTLVQISDYLNPPILSQIFPSNKLISLILYYLFMNENLWKCSLLLHIHIIIWYNSSHYNESFTHFQENNDYTEKHHILFTELWILISKCFIIRICTHLQSTSY